jgi:DNA-binding transcriptional regulator GbsR (MarR family)
MRDNTDDAYQKVFTFLDVKNFHSNFEEKFVSKTDDKIDKNSKMYKRLKKIFKKDVSELEKFLGYKTGWW